MPTPATTKQTRTLKTHNAQHLMKHPSLARGGKEYIRGGRGHLKSPTRLVWPPWMKSSSGGPSSASSGLCSSPMRLKLHTLTRLSAEHDPRMVSSNDAHWTPNTWRRAAGWDGWVLSCVARPHRKLEQIGRSNRLETVRIPHLYLVRLGQQGAVIAIERRRYVNLHTTFLVVLGRLT